VHSWAVHQSSKKHEHAGSGVVVIVLKFIN
jgi:hypothetical protein